MLINKNTLNWIIWRYFSFNSSKQQLEVLGHKGYGENWTRAALKGKWGTVRWDLVVCFNEGVNQQPGPKICASHVNRLRHSWQRDSHAWIQTPPLPVYQGNDWEEFHSIENGGRKGERGKQRMGETKDTNVIISHQCPVLHDVFGLRNWNSLP